MENKKRKNLAGLNYLRAISALLVVFYHYTTRYWDIVYDMGAEKGRIGLWWGCWAVSVFFILSAFLTLYSLNEKTDVKGYLEKRFIRLFPAYWAAIIITTVVTYLFMPTMKIDIKSTLINFTMLQGFIGIRSVDGAYWTLRYELEFYFVIAASIFLLNHIKLKKGYEKISTLWILSVLILEFVPLAGIPNFIISALNIILMIKYAHAFIIGMSLFYILNDKKNYLSYFNLALALLVHMLNFSLMYTVFIVFVVGIIILSVKKDISFKCDKILIWISKISFPLYLVHQKVGYTIIYHFEKSKYGVCPGIILAFMISLALAHCIHIFIEEPVLNAYKSRKTLFKKLS